MAVIKKRGVIFSKRALRVPGLAVLLPMDASIAARRKAYQIVQEERTLSAQKAATLRMAEMESKLARAIRGKEFVIARQPYKQSKLFFTSRDGKRVTIKQVSGRGKVETVKDFAAVSYYIELALNRIRGN